MFYILFNGYHRLLMINLMETPNETVKSTGEKKRKKKKKKVEPQSNKVAVSPRQTLSVLVHNLRPLLIY